MSAGKSFQSFSTILNYLLKKIKVIFASSDKGFKRHKF